MERGDSTQNTNELAQGKISSYEDLEDGEIIETESSTTTRHEQVPWYKLLTSVTESNSKKNVPNDIGIAFNNKKLVDNTKGVGKNGSAHNCVQLSNGIENSESLNGNRKAEWQSSGDETKLEVLELFQTAKISNLINSCSKMPLEIQKFTQENGNFSDVAAAALDDRNDDASCADQEMTADDAKLTCSTSQSHGSSLETNSVPVPSCPFLSDKINLVKQLPKVDEDCNTKNLEAFTSEKDGINIKDCNTSDHGDVRKRKILSGDDDDDDDDDNENFFCATKRLYVDFNTMDETAQSCNDVEYDVIDDLELSNDADYDSNNSCDWNMGWANSSDSDRNDVPEDEIDAMLDEGLDAYRRKKQTQGQNDHGIDDDDLSHEEREKVVLKVRGHDHFEILPEGWIEVTHNSGMPVYLNKVSRVCTLSKPYFLGPGSARKHEIPITAIPCLHYWRELEKEKIQDVSESGQVEEIEASPSDNGTNKNNCDDSKASLPSAKIETVYDNNKEKSLDYLQVREYCKRLFEFQTITVRRFKTWAGRRKHQKLMKQLQRPTLPSGTKLITCPLPPCSEKEETTPVKPRREFTMNPNGKSHVCILHEYVQHAMRVQPKYTFKELENAKKPYGATVIIKDMEYGTGYGSSKKQAKSEAAKATLEILIPQIKDVNSENTSTTAEQQDLIFFDEVRIEDPRISELCAKAGQPSPYQILLECLKRNYGMGDTEVKLEMHTLKHQKNEFTMRVGKHEAKVICKNKRDGKQRASQAILQLLHPHITSWGSLLRLYGKGSCKTLKEKKLEEQQITELQSRASANRPNVSILNKLKEEMLKLKEKEDAVKPIGKFKPGDLELPSDSGSNLKNLDL